MCSRTPSSDIFMVCYVSVSIPSYFLKASDEISFEFSRNKSIIDAVSRKLQIEVLHKSGLNSFRESIDSICFPSMGKVDVEDLKKRDRNFQLSGKKFSIGNISRIPAVRFFFLTSAGF